MQFKMLLNLHTSNPNLYICCKTSRIRGARVTSSISLLQVSTASSTEVIISIIHRLTSNNFSYNMLILINNTFKKILKLKNSQEITYI